MKRSKYGVSLDAGDFKILKCTAPFAHQTQPAEYSTEGAGESLSDTIRDAGIRCETCEHFTITGRDSGGPWGDCSDQKIEIMDAGYFFCAHHSKFQNEE